MYRIEYTCCLCRNIFKPYEVITFKGLCPYDGTILDLEFTTLGYKNAQT